MPGLIDKPAMRETPVEVGAEGQGARTAEDRCRSDRGGCRPRLSAEPRHLRAEAMTAADKAGLRGDRQGHVMGSTGAVRHQKLYREPGGYRGPTGRLADETGRRSLEMRVIGAAKGVVDRTPDRGRGSEPRGGAAGLRLYLPRSALPQPDGREYYHADLIGLEAVLGDGTPVGRVRAVHDFGAGDTLEIERPTRRQRWCPSPARSSRSSKSRQGGWSSSRRPGLIADSGATDGPDDEGTRMTWRATVLTMFPEMCPARWRIRSPAARCGRALVAGAGEYPQFRRRPASHGRRHAVRRGCRHGAATRRGRRRGCLRRR